jgi:hypothetical protein
MSERLWGDRRSFLKGVGTAGVAGVLVTGASAFGGGSDGGSTLTLRAHDDGTEYHLRLSDSEASVTSAPEASTVDHRNGKTFFSGELDTGGAASVSFDGGLERADLTAGACSLGVDDPSGNFDGGISAEGHGFYHVVTTDAVGKAKNIETEDATMRDTLQGTVDDDVDYYEAEGAIRHADLKVIDGEELKLAHSFVEQ